MSIEEVAEQTPELIFSQMIDPVTGVQSYHGRKVAYELGLSDRQVEQMVRLVSGLYQAFISNDASLIEINPLIVDDRGDLIALDAKMTFDDNASFRQKAIAKLRDIDEEDPMETQANKYGLSYIKLDGNIGCMVNGAGLAMATMDIIKLYGGQPANFLDVGGGATSECVTAAFKIISSDPNVEGILVNIFGGIMRCDVIAAGVLAAAREVSLSVPLVVRLAGTNADLGNKLLTESNMPVMAADDLADAAQKIVKAIEEVA